MPDNGNDITQVASSGLASWTSRRTILATLAVLSVIVSFWLLYRFRLVVFTLFVAIVISTAIKPAVDWLHRRRLPRVLGVILVYLVLLALLAGSALLLVPLIFDQVATIIPTLSDYYQSVRSLLLSSPSRLIWRIGGQLPSELTIGVTAQPAEDETLNMVAQALHYVGQIGKSIFAITAVLLLGFYWTLDGERTIRSMMLLVPRDWRENAREFIATAEARVGAYLRAQTILCLSVGSMALVAYVLIGLPYALVLGLIAGVMEVVKYKI